ncbi:MAG: DNA-processing protein DprA [Spirochaetes bacterium]|nr:DNA-processing protein DprA [Spirochaetota bacterium]
MNDRAIFAIALAIASEPVRRGIYRLVEQGLSAEEIFRETNAKEPLATQPFISELYSTSAIKAAEKIARECEQRRIDIIDFWHGCYPPLLREIRYPPLVLYRKGISRIENCFSIVGTRNADVHAIKVANIFAASLARGGFTIVSGMALGIDTSAHIGALDAGGATIGVLANGIDVMYPLQNRDLFDRIVSSEGSCLFSEYPPRVVAGKWTFVRRNRIISGISRGTLVVKAGAKSGALITARYALEQGREVFACPGTALDEGYEGCHALIRAGAVLAATPDDIFKELHLPIAKDFTEAQRLIAHEMVEGMSYLYKNERDRKLSNSTIHFPPDSIEQKILEYASPSCDIDELIRKLGFDVAVVNEKITYLEIEGLIEKRGTTICVRPS